MKSRHIAAVVTTGLAIVLAVAPIPRGDVEELYSRRLYLTFQPWLTAASNRAPFALLDLLLVGKSVV